MWFDEEFPSTVIRACVKGSKEATSDVFPYDIDKLGLTPDNVLDDKNHLELVTKGILELFDCHFSLKPALKHADLLAKLLFDNTILGYPVAKHVGFKNPYEGKRYLEQHFRFELLPQ